MTDASEGVKRVADRYIARDGGMTGPQRAAERHAKDVVAVAAFIAWQEDGEIWGGVKKEEALAAFCRIVKLPQVKIVGIVKPEPKNISQQRSK